LYFTPVRQEPEIDLAQKGFRQGRRNSKNISPLELDKGRNKSAQIRKVTQEYKLLTPHQIVKALPFFRCILLGVDIVVPENQKNLPK